MTIIMLKRMNVPLDRDVIFLSEAGEEGASRLGIQFMADSHFEDIDAEYCLAEGGNGTRMQGKVQFSYAFLRGITAVRVVLLAGETRPICRWPFNDLGIAQLRRRDAASTSLGIRQAQVSYLFSNVGQFSSMVIGSSAAVCCGGTAMKKYFPSGVTCGSAFGGTLNKGSGIPAWKAALASTATAISLASVPT
jgi:hypothetical protein